MVRTRRNDILLVASVRFLVPCLLLLGLGGCDKRQMRGLASADPIVLDSGWTEPVLVSTAAKDFSSLRSLHIDSRGSAYVAWGPSIGGSTWFRSKDGDSWSIPVIVPLEAGLQDLVALPNGRVLAVYLRGIDEPGSSGTICDAHEEVESMLGDQKGTWFMPEARVSGIRKWQVGWHVDAMVTPSGKVVAAWERRKMDCEHPVYVPFNLPVDGHEEGRPVSEGNSKEYAYAFYAVFDGKTWGKELYLAIPSFPVTSLEDMALGNSGELYFLLSGSDQRALPLRETYGGVRGFQGDEECRRKHLFEFCDVYTVEERTTPEGYRACRERGPGTCKLPYSVDFVYNRSVVVGYLLRIKDKKRAFYRLPDMPEHPEPPQYSVMAVDLQEIVHVVWAEGGDGWDAPVDLYYAAWNEGKWSSPVKINTGALHPTPPRLAIGPDSSLHLTWNDGLSDIYYASKRPDSEWSPPDQVTHEGAKDGVNPGHELAVDSKGNVHLVYTAGAFCCPTNVYYTMKPAAPAKPTQPSANGKP